MSKHIEGPENRSPTQGHDCGCGCNGSGGCEEVKEPSARARRALMVGAGSVAIVATLFNRRAFAQQCGPISHAASLNHSQTGQQDSCGGLTPGFWKNHATCVQVTLGGDPNVITLGSVLQNLGQVDPAFAGYTFKAALCDPNSPAYHWAGAILDALSPGFNPHYGYDIPALDGAILTAYKQGLSATSILDALETLENDYGTNPTGDCMKGNDPLC